MRFLSRILQLLRLEMRKQQSTARALMLMMVTFRTTGVLWRHLIQNKTHFEAIAAVPCIPGPSGCQNQKHHVELLKWSDVIAAKREKKEDKKKLSVKLMKAHPMKKKVDKQNRLTNKVAELSKKRKLAKSLPKRKVIEVLKLTVVRPKVNRK